MKDMFEEYVKSRILQNWKFWIVSLGSLLFRFPSRQCSRAPLEERFSRLSEFRTSSADFCLRERRFRAALVAGEAIPGALLEVGVGGLLYPPGFVKQRLRDN